MRRMRTYAVSTMCVIHLHHLVDAVVIDLGVMAHHTSMLWKICFLSQLISLSFCWEIHMLRAGCFVIRESLLGLMAVWTLLLIAWALFER